MRDVQRVMRFLNRVIKEAPIVNTTSRDILFRFETLKTYLRNKAPRGLRSHDGTRAVVFEYIPVQCPMPNIVVESSPAGRES